MNWRIEFFKKDVVHLGTQNSCLDHKLPLQIISGKIQVTERILWYQTVCFAFNGNLKLSLNKISEQIAISSLYNVSHIFFFIFA